MQKKINIINININEDMIIESSAGTGKTHAISLIYLKLLLGIDYPKSLPVEKILIITFTNLAVEELKKRISNNIYELKLACFKKKVILKK
ncbi:UvrD-helicase domain-containing protein [Buchnera aphidicola (Neophyllaphis podocarpi)]|uniref:UvrD-helicase domain-containing protein n=1 Tax=Buchnera aphidicola TaxID=9 RepID=UPI0031B860E0